MSAATNDPGRLSLDEILERLKELESKSQPTTEPLSITSSLPPPPIDLRDEREPKPVAERHGPEHHRQAKKENAPIPERQPTLRTMAKEMADLAPARPIAAPPTVPKAPIGADGRYGRSGSTTTPKPEKPSATPINLTEFEARPKPVDISVEPEDAVIVPPRLTQTRQLDFKQLVMITFYVAIVLFAVAAAIYIR